MQVDMHVLKMAFFPKLREWNGLQNNTYLPTLVLTY